MFISPLRRIFTGEKALDTSKRLPVEIVDAHLLPRFDYCQSLAVWGNIEVIYSQRAMLQIHQELTGGNAPYLDRSIEGAATYAWALPAKRMTDLGPPTLYGKMKKAAK